MAEKVRRTREERVADIDSKIQYHKDCIASLKKKKEEILNPQKRMTKAQRMKTIMNKAQATMTPEEIADKLGITIE